MPRIFIAAMLLLASCTNQPVTKNTIPASGADEKHAETGYVWRKLLDSSDWKKSYNFQMFSKGDSLLVFHRDGTWVSTDGKSWIKTGLPNAVNNLAFLDYVYFNNAVYGLGNLQGNIEHYSFKPEIYKTTDFKTWQTISANSNLPKRFFYHPFVFKNNIWIIGGEDSNTQYADIWNSDDGINWLKQKDSLPFGKRANSQVVQLKGKLYLLNNDVWSSIDGLTWQLVSNEIVKGELLFGYTAVVLDEKIWLLGCNRNQQFTSNVLYSEDGKNWKQMNAPWLPRGGVAAVAHKGKIYMTGGKYGGTPEHTEFRYDNDLWVLEKE